jgi:drug/metabolite transporter (DMT)-like permease
LASTSMSFSPLIIGGIAALISALLWAISAIIFRNLGKSIPPVELNLVKGCLAVGLMLVTTLLLREQALVMPITTIGLLIISGIVGVGMGDTAYFESLNHLGSRFALLLGMLAPPMTGALAWVFMGETISHSGWLGIVITIAGIAWVITEEQATEENVKINYKKGIQFAVIAALAQAIGAVISRYAMTAPGVTISALQTSIIRLLAGIIYLAVLILLSKKSAFLWLRKDEAGGHTSTWKLLRMVAVVGLLGTYTAVWLQQVSIQFAPVAIAQTLLSTSPLFILPIIALRGEKLSFRAVGGVVVSLVGIVLLFNQ